MERQGEGFEREHVPDLGRAARRPTERERLEEPVVRFNEPSGVPALADLLIWSALWSGFFVALSVIVLIGALGVALGLTTGVAAATAGAISLVVGLFCGGWLAGRSSHSNRESGILHGVGVWAITTTALIILGLIGGAGLLGALGNFSGTVSAMPGMTITTAQLAGWGLFIGLLLGLVASACGGYVGSLYRAVLPRRRPT